MIGYALENKPQVKPVPPGGKLPHVLQRAGLIDINGHDSPHSPTQRNTLIRDHIVAIAYYLVGIVMHLRAGQTKAPQERRVPRAEATPRAERDHASS